MYADDTTLYVYRTSLLDIQCKLQDDMNFLKEWLYANKFNLNTHKTKFMLIGTPQNCLISHLWKEVLELNLMEML